MKEQKRDGHGQTHAHNHKKDNEQLTAEDQGNEITENPQDAVPEIQQKEESAEEKIAELNDRYLRLAAEFDNYRRRTAKERLDLVVTASEDTIIGVLPVLDDCERALEVLRQAEGDHSIAIEGTELIYNKLFTFLESKGLKKIDAKGKDLNTDFHEAIAQFPASGKSHKNKIIEVVQQGYTLNGKVIRFAKVVVGI